MGKARLGKKARGPGEDRPALSNLNHA
jgi:hypothetical protein